MHPLFNNVNHNLYKHLYTIKEYKKSAASFDVADFLLTFQSFLDLPAGATRLLQSSLGMQNFCKTRRNAVCKAKAYLA